jgi:hypothetical protein
MSLIVGARFHLLLDHAWVILALFDYNNAISPSVLTLHSTPKALFPNPFSLMNCRLFSTRYLITSPYSQLG